MAVKARTVVLSGQQQSFDDIARHRTLLHQSVRAWFRAGSAEFCQCFQGAREDEVAQTLAVTLREVDRSAILSLLAAMEAAFRVDYLERVYERRRDPFSRACRALYVRVGHRVSLEQELLKLWLTEGAAAPDFIRHLVGAFRLRHWLAHGRYWSPRRAATACCHRLRRGAVRASARRAPGATRLRRSAGEGVGG
jgi:hypothetical protein